MLTLQRPPARSESPVDQPGWPGADSAGGNGRHAADTRRPVLVLNDVTKTYPNGRNALQDVDLVVPEGDFVFLVGSSGAGKSTLMKLLIRDELPTMGSVILDGDDLARLPRRKVPIVRRKIGIVFQDFKLLPTKTVRENIAFALEVTGTPRRRIRPAVERVLKLVGLTQQAEQYPNQLSGGEQQRTAIARALVNRPSLILADEPIAELDSVTGLQVLKLLMRIRDVENVTIVIATHDATIHEVADRTYHIVDGRIARIETYDDATVQVA